MLQGIANEYLHEFVPAFPRVSRVGGGGIYIDRCIRSVLSALCRLACSESDRKVIKYTACASRNLSAKEACSTYGISSYNQLKCEVEEALEKACEITAIEEKAFLRTLGMDISSDSESEVEFEASSSCEWTSEDSHTDLDEGHKTGKEHTDPKQFSSYDLSTCSNAEKLAEYNVAEIDLNANSTTENMTLLDFSSPGS